MSTNNKNSSFRVMTYNVRTDQEDDEQNQWKFRKDHVINLVENHAPDLLGVQEPLAEQVTDLKTALPEFEEYGVGSVDGENQGEFNTIFYRFVRFELLEKGTFWLSEKPEISGSKGWDANKARTCVWVKLRDRRTQQAFYYFNTHVDQTGLTARLESARLLLDRIQKVADTTTPVILVGGMNTSPDSDPFRTITMNSLLQDPMNLTESPHEGPDGTMVTFSVSDQVGDRIDYIFVTPGNIRVLKHAILTDSNNECYPSDHLPVVAEMTIRGDVVPAQQVDESHASVLAKIVLKNTDPID